MLRQCDDVRLSHEVPVICGRIARTSLAHKSRIESRMALRGNHTLRSSQACENIALARRDGLAMLQCISLTTAHNIVRQSNTSWGNLSFALFSALSQIVR
jgi:hypothetical protein